MIWLILGVTLWSCVHLMRRATPGLRQRIIDQVGADPYKGLFSLAIVASIVLMVIGWRSGPASIIYAPPVWGRSAALVLMFVALVLLAASGVPTNIKRALRHPQLTSVCVWAIAHLLANGDSHSVVLFGGIGAWALVSMLAINRREQDWQPPPTVSATAEIKPIVGGLVVYVVLLFAHQYLFGVSPL